MATIERVKIEGLAEFNRNLKRLDSDLPKALRLALNEAGDVIVAWAKPRVPRRSGRAAGSIKAKSTRTEVRVSGGGTRVPYYPWLDFGGSVGRNKSIKRKFFKVGRYIYPGLSANYASFQETLTNALIRVADAAGVEVD